MADLAAPAEAGDTPDPAVLAPSQDPPSTETEGTAATAEGLIPGGALRDPPDDPFSAAPRFPDTTSRLLNPALADLREALDAPFRIPADWGEPADISVPLWDPADEPDSLRSRIHRYFGYDVLLDRLARGLPPYDSDTAADNPDAALVNAFAEGGREGDDLVALAAGRGARIAGGAHGMAVGGGDASGGDNANPNAFVAAGLDEKTALYERLALVAQLKAQGLDPGRDPRILALSRQIVEEEARKRRDLVTYLWPLIPEARFGSGIARVLTWLRRAAAFKRLFGSDEAQPLPDAPQAPTAPSSEPSGGTIKSTNEQPAGAPKGQSAGNTDEEVVPHEVGTAGDGGTTVPNAGTPPHDAGSVDGGQSDLGEWREVREGMSDRARSYQRQITGRTGEAHVVNGVKFDGVGPEGLIDAKGPGYAKFLDGKGEWKTWARDTVANDLAEQAERQVIAANGRPVVWHVAEPEAAEAIQQLVGPRVRVIYTPPAP
jgi:hypothetical protein